MMEDDQSDVDDPGSPQQGSSKRSRKQGGGSAPKRLKVFQEKWLNEPDFKGWLSRVPGNENLARCLCCGKDLKAGKSELQKHRSGPTHEKAAKQFKGIKSIQEALAAPRKSAKQLYEDDVKKMEIGLAAFFAEHNVAFQPADHLVKVVKRGAKDSAIVKDITLGRLKCAAIVKNVIAKVETEELVEELKKTEFSVLFDESTDKANKKHMCLLVRYYTHAKSKPQTAVLELIELDARDCTAEGLWNEFLHCLEKHEIPLRNIIGVGCDNASVNIGSFNSFWTRLKARCPWAILIACTCHSSALASREACNVLPSFVQSHLKDVATYLNRSPQRCAQLEDFQELYEEEQTKILKLADTRWLVLQKVAKRYLEHYESLYAFFRTKVRESPRDKEAQRIFQDMNNVFLKAYILFLEYALGYFNEFNGLFQSQDVLIHKLSESSRKLLKKICQNYIKPEELNRMETTNVTHPSNFVSIENVYLGPACTKYLAEMKAPPGEKTKTNVELAREQRELDAKKLAFRLKCQEFYITAAKEIKNRLPKGKIFDEMAFLDPAVALSAEARVTRLPDLDTLTSNFERRLDLDLNALAVEWRTMPTEIEGDLRKKLLASSVPEMWAEIDTLRNFSGEKVFPQLSRLSAAILSLPHSDAEAERSFSVVTDVKTKKRNRLGHDSLNAIAVTRSAFTNKGVTCSTFAIKDAHLKKFTSAIYGTKD